MESKLLDAIETAYKNQDFDETSKLCAELYKFKTSKELSDESKTKLSGIINMSYKGFRPPFEEIKTALYGLIELAIAPNN